MQRVFGEMRRAGFFALTCVKCDVALTELFFAQVADFEIRGPRLTTERSVTRLEILCSFTLMLLISAVLDVFGRNTDCMLKDIRPPGKLADLERGRRRRPIISGWLKKFSWCE